MQHNPVLSRLQEAFLWHFRNVYSYSTSVTHALSDLPMIQGETSMALTVIQMVLHILQVTNLCNTLPGTLATHKLS